MKCPLGSGGDRRERQVVNSYTPAIALFCRTRTTTRRFSASPAGLFALSHCARRKHSGEWGLTLLKQDICHIISTVLAEFLVQGSITGGRGVAFYFNHVTFDRLGFLHQRHQLSSIFWPDLDLAIVKVHNYFIHDVVIVQLAEPRDGSFDSCLIFCDLCLLLLQGLSLSVQLRLLLFQLHLLFFQLCLGLLSL